MKKIVCGNLLLDKMKEAINNICDAVSITLGPTGNNVLISSSITSSYITNDGVTIAENIYSDDLVVNAILSIIKEASLKTNEMVGDGTTTTLVLLKEIYYNGLEAINNGISPILLKKEMDCTLNNIVEKILEYSKKPLKKDLLSVAYNSSNDELIANMVYNVYMKVKNSFNIKLEESNSEKTYYELKKGYEVMISSIPDYLFKNKNKIVLNNCKIILMDKIYDFDGLEHIINEILNSNENLCIIATEISELVKQNIISLNINNNLPIYYIEIPTYETNKYMILEDISAIININDLKIGKVDYLEILKESAILYNKERNKMVKKQIINIKKNLEDCNNSYQRDLMLERISKLENNGVVIYVGGNTSVEKKEKKMRFEDCINAVETAKKGVVIGEGLIFYKVLNNLKIENNGDAVIYKSIVKPFIQIMDNSNLDYKLIINEIEKSYFSKIFNIKNNNYEDLSISKIIDPTYVVIEALKNAVSIAGMLLTTKYLIINEDEKYKNSIEI